jgi:Xaa-Pro aminopeptidase
LIQVSFHAAAKSEALITAEFREESKYRQSSGSLGWTKESALRFRMPPVFSMRLRKSPMELELMQHAIDIGIEAHQRARPRYRPSGNTKLTR